MVASRFPELLGRITKSLDHEGKALEGCNEPLRKLATY